MVASPTLSAAALIRLEATGYGTESERKHDMYSYLSYGFTIHATLPLPELIPAPGHPDVVIRPGKLPLPPGVKFEGERYFQAEPGEAFLAWRNTIHVRVCSGREVVFEALGDMPESWLRQCLLGPALGVLLHQRGLVVLHASAVGINGQACVFVGCKGQGKSTTAASLLTRGHDLLADDIVAIDLSEPQRPLVLPGFSQLKLWPDTVAALGIDENELTLLHPEYEKKGRSVAAASTQSPWPLQSIYVLDQGEAHDMMTLPLMEAFSEIVGNSYATRFIGKAGLVSPHFQQFIALAQAIPVHRFKRQLSLALLPEALDLLTVHMQSKCKTLKS